MKFVLVDVEVVVTSDPAKVYTVVVYVGKVMSSTESVVAWSAARPVEVGGVTVVVVVSVTIDPPPVGETPLIQWVVPFESTV